MAGERAPAIVIHGGAGAWPNDRRAAAIAGCEEAARVGLSLLAAGGCALDAVQAAVVTLERNAAFNAGLGSVLTREGTVEVDAAIMDGRGARIGGIGAVSRVDRPIELAREVLDDGEHGLLCGAGAQRFATERGFTLCAADALVTERARRRLAKVAAARRAGERDVSDPGTVGAVAIDRNGHVAAATSTGGTTYKRAGRVGDTPLAGSGTYADDASGAASATGHGESIMRATMTRVCCDAMARGLSASEAARHAVEVVEAFAPGTVGIIAVDRTGRLGAAHGTPRMAWATGRIGPAGQPTIQAAMQVDDGDVG